MNNSLVLTQKQQLKLNTQMIQSLELMTLTIQELSLKIENEILTNPTLVAEEPERNDRLSYEDYVEKVKSNDKVEDYSDSSSYGSDLSDSHQAWLEGAVSTQESLQDHLNFQLGCMYDVKEEVFKVASKIITSLDSNGFYKIPLDEILSQKEREVKDEALEVLHALDPVGIAVVDYKESLILQAKALGVKDKELEIFSLMVNEYLDKLKSSKFKEVSKALKVEEEDVDALFSFLKTLSPYPGSRFSSEFDGYIIPDLSIKKEDGRLVLRLNNSALPILSVDSNYQEMEKEVSSKKDEKSKEASKYLKNKIHGAETLISQIALRNSTLEKVGKVLLIKQKAFFLFGPQSLKPLILKQVAEEINVHETTISRITTSKYIDTDYGVLPLKTLFSSALITGKNEEGIAKNAVKDMIREIIENNEGKALSDQKISDLLAEKDIKCARRTVNKYRKELDIDSSFIRGN